MEFWSVSSAAACACNAEEVPAIKNLLDSAANVQGMQISLSAASINEALGLPNPPKAELKAREMDDNG
ncbi:hypothetical protein HAX54_006607 [Datura stramonium]|uniref:Uncharacterized protein n=1 Tax=Datura stramonium TaxID=4076 RepID=A0ABS8TCY1_DATST|nr:hypothetical protein [Datura stramonium]